jgi:ankyrin repeat protein
VNIGDTFKNLLKAGDFPAAETLLREHGDTVLYPKDDMYPLEAFSNAANRFDVLDWLLAQGADVNAYSSEWQSPLFHAFDDLALDVAKYLMDKGASLTRRNFLGYDALLLAVETVMDVAVQDPDPNDLVTAKAILRAVVERGVDVNSVNNQGESTLHIIVRMCLCLSDWDARKIVDTVEYLLDSGVSLTLKCGRGKTAPEIAVTYNLVTLSGLFHGRQQNP